MNEKYEELLKSKMSEESYGKLIALENEKLFNFVGEYAELCEPAGIFMADDSDEDAEYIRQQALDLGEEKQLARENVTMHYDGKGDQARDKANTKFLVQADKLAGMGNLNCVEYERGYGGYSPHCQRHYEGQGSDPQIVLRMSGGRTLCHWLRAVY